MLTPEHHAAWMASVNELRHLEDDDLADDRAFVLAVADHVVALEAQVAEARRVMAEDVIRPFLEIDGGECLVCGWVISPPATHAPTCRVGKFLAATAGSE